MKYVSGENWKVWIGDVDAGLSRVADNSVHCVVTSPPYYDLRDYGTGTWSGGSPECKHEVGRFVYEVTGSQKSNAGSGSRKAKRKCPHCGAVRIDSQIGAEPTPEDYVARMVSVFREVRRVLRDDGTLWLNLGDSYAAGGNGGGNKNDTNKGSLTVGPKKAPGGFKPKDIMGIPWRVALALQADGWYLRQDIIWNKPNPMPESVRDRCTKAHEYIFLLAKSERYYYDADAVSESSVCESVRGPALHPDSVSTNGNAGLSRRARTGSRNRRSVWTVGLKPYSGAHFATMPPSLVEPCIMAATSDRGCCPDCGKQWRRVAVSIPVYRYRPNAITKRNGSDGTGNFVPNDVSHLEVRTLGWMPDCGCYGVDLLGPHPKYPRQRPNEPQSVYRERVAIYDEERAKWLSVWSGVSAEYRMLPTVGAVVLDPFSGSGTTGMVANELGRSYIGCELNPEYALMSRKRIPSWRYRTASSRPDDLPGQKLLEFRE